MKTLCQLTIAFLLVSLSPALAQGDLREGYYISIHGDSISGFIDYRMGKSPFKSCVFSDDREAFVEFMPDQVLAYGFVNGFKYVSRVLPQSRGGEKVFLEILVEGQMSLLTHGKDFYVETDTLIFLPKVKKEEPRNDHDLLLNIEKPYKGILNYLLSECMISANKTKYIEGELTDLIKEYNKCKGIEPRTYREKLPWFNLSLGAYSGLDFSKFTHNDWDNDVFKGSSSPIFGTCLALSSPRIFDRWFLNVELAYIDKFYQGYIFSEPSSGSFQYEEYFVNTSFLKIPAGVQYNFSQSNKTPYIKGGMVYYCKISGYGNVLTELESSQVVTVENKPWNSTNNETLRLKGQAGLYLGVGYCKELYNGLNGFTEIRIDSSNGLMGQSIFRSSSSAININLLLGIEF